jgi:hypothetical protein
MNKSICFGIQNEKTLLPILQKYFNDETIEKTSFVRCPFDFVSENGTLYELKTRRCFYEKYPDTIFPTKKFDYQPEKEKYLIFSFNNGNYYIKYEPLVFETFKKEFKQFRFDRGALDKPAEYIHIPIDRLIPMTLA